MDNKNMSPKTKRIIIIIVEIIVTLGIAIWTILWDGISFGQGVAILSATISMYFVISQNLVQSLFEDIDQKAFDYHKNQMAEMSQIAKSIDIEEIYKKIYKIKNDEQKKIYIKSIKNFTDTMKSRMEGERSGALAPSDYYEQLQSAASEILEDKKHYEKRKPKSVYPGEIWAMTVWQDDELDFETSSIRDLEKNWVNRMATLDANEISTVRICIMKDRLPLLKRLTIDDEVVTFLQKLFYYCKRDTPCPNTKMLAVNNIDDLSPDERLWINKGFFAIMLSNGSKRLIRGVSLDNANATTLGGEIDFNVERVNEVKHLWDRLRETRAISLLDFLWDNCSESVKNKMEEMGFPK